MEMGVMSQCISQQSQRISLQSVSTKTETGETTLSLEGGEERWETGWLEGEVREIQHSSTGTFLEELQNFLMAVYIKEQ